MSQAAQIVNSPRDGVKSSDASGLAGSIAVLTGCAENSDYTQREKNQSKNTVAPTPGQARAEQRQRGEHNEVARLDVHALLPRHLLAD